MRNFKKISWLALFGVILGITPIASAQGIIGNCEPALGENNIDVNNVRARIPNNGELFYRSEPHLYNVPKTTSSNALFASGIWIGGQIGGQLYMAATRYGPYEFWAGPLNESGDSPVDCSVFDHSYSIYRTDVDAYEAGGAATPDMVNWPTGLGAPTMDANGDMIDLLDQDLAGRVDRVIDLAAGERPAILGDQTIWWVMNDMGNTHDASGGLNMGIEVHGMVFAFDVAGDIGNATFYKYKLFYKGSVPLENAYMSIFSDPDLGDAGDDYVGSDTTLGIGYVYNSDNSDIAGEGYGEAPPAVGYDFFQGPIVPAPGETAFVSGVPVPDFKNLKMTGFMFYNNGGGVNEDPTTAEHYYDYMQMNWKNGESVTFGGNGFNQNTTNEPTNFMYPGDPGTPNGEYWSERVPCPGCTANPAADRRFVMTSGPFTINPGDVQEIVFGIPYGRGADNWDSVNAMRKADALAQAAFDVQFDLPQAPSKPSVTWTELDGKIVIEWSNSPTSNNYLDSYTSVDPFAPLDDPDYVFEVYRIWQFDENADLDGRVIQTYDVPNGITTVIDGFPGDVTEVVMRGSDNGAQTFAAVEGLVNYQTYYLGVQAFAYNEGSFPKIFGSPIVRFTAEPRRSENVISEKASEASLDFGTSDFEIDAVQVGAGVVVVDIVNPAAVIEGAEYQVVFYEMELAGKRSIRKEVATHTLDVDELSGSGEAMKFASAVGTTYDIKRDGTVLFNGNIDGAIAPQRANVIVFDGLQFSITGPEPDWADFVVVANAAGPVDPPDGAAADFRDFPGTGRASSAQQVGGGLWHVATGMSSGCPTNCGDYGSFLVRSMRNGFDLVSPWDFEVRFAGTTSLHYDRFTVNTGVNAGGIIDDGGVPFEIWNIGIATPDDPSDDFRMIPATIDWDSDGFNLTPEDHTSSGGDNDPNTDWFYWYNPVDMSPGTVGYDAWAAAALDGDAGAQLGSEVMARFVFYDWNGGSVGDYLDDPIANPFRQLMPEVGTIFRLTTLKPNQPDDVFTFNTTGFGVQPAGAQLKQDQVDDIGIVPNPYKGVSLYERSQLIDEVRFTNLLSEETTIRIFTLNGSIVREMVKNEGVNSLTWNLTTDNNLPIASGLYLVHVDVKGVGETVIKFAVVRKRTQLDTF